MKTKKPFYKRWWFIVVAVILGLSIIGEMFDDGSTETASTKKVASTNSEAAKPEANSKEKQEKSSQEKPKEESKKPEIKKPKEAPKSFDDTVKDTVIKELGTKANTGKKRLVQEGSSDIDGGKSVVVTMAGDELFTTKSTLRQMETNSAKLFEKLFKDKKVARVTLVWRQTLVDTYGKESDDNVLKIELTRATANKIEWKNFNAENFEQVADNYWVHPAMLKK